MEIQLASSTDFVEILFLLRQCTKAMNEKGLKQWNTAYPSPEMIKEDIEQGRLYMFKEKGVAKGMICLSPEIPEEYKDVPWKADSSKVLCIKRFAVHPFWQNSQIGERLIQFSEEFAKREGYTSIRIDVLDSYPVDEGFFAGHKFNMAGSFHSTFQKLPYTCYEKSL